MATAPTPLVSLDDDLSTLPLYHAETHGGTGGIAFYLGERLAFAPWNEDTLYWVPKATLLTLTAVIPADMATFLATVKLEPLFAQLTAARRAHA